GNVASLRIASVRRVRARIGGADAADARAAFERIPGVEGLDADPSTGSGIGAGAESVQLSATIEGTIDPFVKALAQYEVQELTIAEPDLEESVLRLYGDAASLFPSPPSAPPGLIEAPSYRRRQAGASTRRRGADGENEARARRRDVRKEGDRG